MKKIFRAAPLLVVLYLLNVSCSSFPYRNIKRAENNTFTIETNLSNVNVKCLKPGEKYEQELGETENRSNSKNEFEYTFDRLRSKQLKLELYGDNLESQIIKIKRSPRAGAIVKDVLLSTITFGLPIIIDPFRADFYKISPKSKHITVYMKYTQQYMLDEYMKIKENSNPQVFADYLTKYSYSNCSELATNKKDSLEFIIAVRKSEERAIDDYISDHPKSKFLPMAQSIKNEMTESRVAYDQAKKIDKAIAYEAFINKYPNSLEIKGAFTRMIDAAESECIKANKLDSTLFYLTNYLDKYKDKSDVKVFNGKRDRVNTLLEDQIVTELDIKVTDKYQAYKAAWEQYLKLTKKYNYLSLSKIAEYENKIYVLLFQILKEKSDKESQKAFLDKINMDFPVVSASEISGNRREIPLVIQIIENTTSKNGLLKLYGVNFIENHMKNLAGGWSDIPDIYSYTYKSNKYNTFTNVNYEEITFKDNTYSSIKLFNEKTPIAYFTDLDNIILSCHSFFKNGQLIKEVRMTIKESITQYSYEFENGVNLSLKELSENLDLADKALASKEYQKAVDLYSKCFNDFPYEIPLNQRLGKSIENASQLLDAHNKKQEEKRLAEERKQEQARLAEERKRELTSKNNLKSVKIGKLYKTNAKPYYYIKFDSKTLTAQAFNSKNESICGYGKYSIDLINKGVRIKYEQKYCVDNLLFETNSDNTIITRLYDNDDSFYLVEEDSYSSNSNIPQSTPISVYKFYNETNVTSYLYNKTFYADNNTKIMLNYGEFYINNNIAGNNPEIKVLSETKALISIENIYTGGKYQYYVDSQSNCLTDKNFGNKYYLK